MKLKSLRIQTPPTKTTYMYDDALNTDGLVVMGTYWLDTYVLPEQEVTGYTIEVPSGDTSHLRHSDTYFIIKMSGGGETCTVNCPITISPILTSITVTTGPTKSAYKYKETFQNAGIILTGTKSNNDTITINSGYTTNPTNGTVLTKLGSNTIAVSYVNEKNTTLTANTTITVNKADGVLSVASALPSSAFSNNMVYISMGNWSDQVQLTFDKHDSDGALSITKVSGDTSSVNASTDTQTKVFVSNADLNATVAKRATLRVTLNEGTYYTSTTYEFQVNIVYWEWGSETGTANAQWWEDLRMWAATATPAERLAQVGKTKSVTLTSAVLGTTTHLVRCIGADQDGIGTLTFQTANCLANTTVWSTTASSSSNTTAARWVDGNCKAKKECINYYNAFPGKASIKTVSKGTCSSYGDRNQGVTYNDETVWLPSEREMGLDSYSPISVANSTTSKAECTQGYNEAYSYYNSNNRRIKNLGDNGNVTWYWERSRYYGSGDPYFVCGVNTDGSAGNTGYWNYSGLAPAWVIG